MTVQERIDMMVDGVYVVEDEETATVTNFPENRPEGMINSIF